MKNIYFATIFALFCWSNAASAADAACLKQNKEIAQAMLNSASASIGHRASEVTPSALVFESGDRYEFDGFIYKGVYKIVVKTDQSCFLKEVELIDMATR